MITLVNHGLERIGALSRDAVFIYDFTTLKFAYVNERFAEIFEISKDEVLAQPVLLLPMINTEDAVYLRHLYHELVNLQKIHNTEFRLNTTTGKLKHLQCDAFLIEDNLVAGFLKDVTNEKQHEDYIMNYGAKKDTLLDMLTHNLAGPLYLTQNIIRHMQSAAIGSEPEKITTQLQIIQATTQECVDIVDDFLKEEHMESERIYVKKTRFDLLERIAATLDKLVATNKDKTFRLSTKLTNLNITTDSVKFFQAIHNLISNSIKFTPEGGEIEIMVEELETTFKVHVSDNGVGIPVNLQPDLFLKKTASTRPGLNNQKSSGLGLHIVKMLVTLMGGTVSFKSQENKGSTFTVELPKD